MTSGREYCVALTWSISHKDKLVVVHLSAEFKLEDIPRAYAEVIAQGGLPYRKLVDLAEVPLDIGVLDIGSIGRFMREGAGGASRGPVAFIVDNDAVNDMAETFDRKTFHDRPLGIFRDKESAMRWLDEVAPPGDNDPTAVKE